MPYWNTSIQQVMMEKRKQKYQLEQNFQTNLRMCVLSFLTTKVKLKLRQEGCCCYYIFVILAFLQFWVESGNIGYLRVQLLLLFLASASYPLDCLSLHFLCNCWPLLLMHIVRRFSNRQLNEFLIIKIKASKNQPDMWIS